MDELVSADVDPVVREPGLVGVLEEDDVAGLEAPG